VSSVRRLAKGFGDVLLRHGDGVALMTRARSYVHAMPTGIRT
jgi:hypothetical protein